MASAQSLRPLRGQCRTAGHEHFPQQVDGFAQLGTVGTQQIERRTLATQFRQDHAQAAGQHIAADIQPGFIGDAHPGHRPAAHHIGIVAESVATDGQADVPSAVVKGPVVMDPAAEHIEQAIVLSQLFQMPRLSVTRKVTGRGAQYAHIVRCDGQSDQAGILGLAIAQGDIHRLAKQVSDPIAQQEPHGELRVVALELVQPRQQVVATKSEGADSCSTPLT